MTSTPVPDGALAWEERRASRLTFYFEPHSYAARRIDEVVRRAESAYQRGWEWFFDRGDGTERPTIAVYLLDALPDADRPGCTKVAGALLGDDAARRTATVRSIRPVELYTLHKDDFRGLLTSQPRLGQVVARLARLRAEQLRLLAGGAAVATRTPG